MEYCVTTNKTVEGIFLYHRPQKWVFIILNLNDSLGCIFKDKWVNVSPLTIRM